MLSREMADKRHPPAYIDPSIPDRDRLTI